VWHQFRGIDSWGAGGASPEFGGSLKGQSMISAYQSLAITASTSGFGKLYMYGNAMWHPNMHTGTEVALIMCQPKHAMYCV
jgi:hypothetical protein